MPGLSYIGVNTQASKLKGKKVNGFLWHRVACKHTTRERVKKRSSQSILHDSIASCVFLLSCDLCHYKPLSFDLQIKEGESKQERIGVVLSLKCKTGCKDEASVRAGDLDDLPFLFWDGWTQKKAGDASI